MRLGATIYSGSETRIGPIALIRVLSALVTLVLALLWVPPAAAVPLVIPDPPREAGLVIPQDPDVTAASWIVYDADAGLVLGSEDADFERPMASTTKMMTALLAFKYGDLDDWVIVSQRATDVGEAEVGLVPGERVRMSDLVTALVVRSANDAAMAVAEHLSGSVEEFVELMNAEAEELGLDHTSFANPHGLDASDHYSSAGDLLDLGLAAMSYPEFRERSVLLEAGFPSAPDGTDRTITHTNVMLDTYPGTIGVKTGFTGEAGLVFVAAATREGRTIFSVVMGSEGERAHFVDAETMLDWGFESFRSVALIGDGAYEPPPPERVVEEEPEPEPEPVVLTETRTSDEQPPDLGEALGWLGRLLGAGSG